jgi:hypothetical protein
MASRLSYLYSVKCEVGLPSRTITVVDFVTVKISRLNSIQQLDNSLLSNLREFHEEHRVEHLVRFQPHPSMPTAISTSFMILDHLANFRPFHQFR